MDSAHPPEQVPVAGHIEEPDTTTTQVGESISVAAAAGRLGVARSAVWHMIAEGDLDAEHAFRHGRVYTRVQLPQRHVGDPDDAPPRSRTARLQEQVERLTLTLERLSTVLLEANRERAEMRQTVRARAAAEYPDPREREEESAPQSPAPHQEQRIFTEEDHQAEPQPVAFSSASRPNPITYPSDPFRARPLARDELLEPVRELFKARRRSWWQRLPLVSRG